MSDHPPIERYDEIDSTNDEAHRLAERGAAHGTVVIADAQTSGRGRRGRVWTTPKGKALAMSIVASAADIMLAFLALQAVNLMAIFLAGYGKRSAPSAEAAVKFLAFGAVAGALLLYGFALLFSSAKGFNIYEIHKALVAAPLSRESMLAVFMLLFLALSFQIGAFPMHLWAPDVLEGAPTPSSAFLSFGTRAAGMAVALRFLIVMFAQPLGAAEGPAAGQWQVLGAVDWSRIVALVSGLTMLVGSLLAVRQKAAKRMVGCLVVAQSGFLLMGLLVLDQVGVAALLYNLVVELFALMGTFYVLAYFFDELHSDRFEDLKGMLGRAVPECICLVLFLACLVGLPPMPGFIGKFALIGAVVRHHWPVLATIAIFATTLSTAAVARLTYYLIGDFRRYAQVGAAGSHFAVSRQRQSVLLGMMVPIVMIGVFAEFVFDWAGKSLGFILW